MWRTFWWPPCAGSRTAVCGRVPSAHGGSSGDDERTTRAGDHHMAKSAPLDDDGRPPVDPIRARRWVRRLVVVGMVMALGTGALTLAPASATAQVTTGRHGGATRYDTAALVATAAFPSGVANAIVVSGLSFPDALTASYLASAIGGGAGAPILLTDPAGLSAPTSQALTSLHVSAVTIVGGTSAVSQAVADQIATIAKPGGGAIAVQRIGGTDRYDTNGKIAAQPGAGHVGTLGGAKAAFVASGGAFPDALATGPASYAGKLPLLLTEPGHLSASVTSSIQALGITKVTIVGGTASVSPEVERSLKALSPPVTVARVAGSDRYDTAARLAGLEVGSLSFSNAAVLLANGASFPDALAGGPLGGTTRSPILLVHDLPSPTASYLSSNQAAITGITALGGPAAISDGTLESAAEAAGRVPPAAGSRATADRPDAVGGYQIHVIYAVASDSPDRAMDTNGQIRDSVSAWNRWLAGQTGGPKLRLDTYGGQLDTTFVRLPRSQAAYYSFHANVRDEVEKDLHAAGFNDPKKIYAVYYDGTSDYSCGGGAWPPNLIGNAAVVYLKGTPPGAPACGTQPVGSSPTTPHYFDFALLHEIVHTLGMVPTCAPHEWRNGHITGDPTDLMWAGDGSWAPAKLDIGRDDYYGANIPGCPDMAKSVFMDPLPSGAVPPPGW